MKQGPTPGCRTQKGALAALQEPLIETFTADVTECITTDNVFYADTNTTFDFVAFVFFLESLLETLT